MFGVQAMSVGVRAGWWVVSASRTARCLGAGVLSVVGHSQRAMSTVSDNETIWHCFDKHNRVKPRCPEVTVAVLTWRLYELALHYTP